MRGWIALSTLTVLSCGATVSKFSLADGAPTSFQLVWSQRAPEVPRHHAILSVHSHNAQRGPLVPSIPNSRHFDCLVVASRSCYLTDGCLVKSAACRIHRFCSASGCSTVRACPSRYPAASQKYPTLACERARSLFQARRFARRGTSPIESLHRESQRGGPRSARCRRTILRCTPATSRRIPS